MKLTSAQLKGRLKSVAAKNGADARILLREYMMERFLERLSKSKYREKFVIKGGILVAAIVGVSMRSTMDIDATITGFDLELSEAERILNDIIIIDVGDDVRFKIIKSSNIMDQMEYPGLRFELDAYMETIYSRIKIDISTGDVITPRAVKFNYKSILDDEEIALWSYNIETVLGEKLQTVLARSVINTRMRDFYDIYILQKVCDKEIDNFLFADAFRATCRKRETVGIYDRAHEIIKDISDSNDLQQNWIRYQRKYLYASDISYDDVVGGVLELYNRIK